MRYTLRQKQSALARFLASLIMFAYRKGYEVTIGEVWRPDIMALFYAEEGIGISNSLHRLKLAVDLNLFRNGCYLKSTKSHKQLGKYWESLSTPGLECCWGGHFGDGNHYSIKHKGVR